MSLENLRKIGIFVAVVGAGAVLSFGLSDLLPFWKTFSVLTYLEVLGFGAYWFWNQSQPKIDTSVDQTIEEYEKELVEQLDVILEYEKIFDSLLIELPCICGGNTFKGLFSPNTENEVECEKCHNKYKVSIQYDTVLVTEPLNVNQTFDKLVGTDV